MESLDELIRDDDIDKKIIYYLCESLTNVINANRSSSDTIKYGLNIFIHSLINTQYQNYFYDYNCHNMFFEKVLSSSNLSTAFNTQLDEQNFSNTQIITETNDETVSEPDGEENTQEMINDIDQEDSEFDVNEDD